MIPLIDVALVLLIIFMILTPFLVRAKIQVNLPDARATERVTAKDQAVSVEVGRDGAFYAQGVAVRDEDLEAALSRMLRGSASQAVMAEADRDVPFQRVVFVLDAARHAGAAQFGVCVRQEAERRTAPRRR